MIFRTRLINVVKLLQDRDHRDHSSRTWLADVDGGSGKVALKDLPRDRFIPEVFASLVAKAVGLSTPAAHVVEVSSEKVTALELDHGLPSGSGSILLYGSEYTEVPPFVKGTYTECLRLFNSDAFSRVIVFDILVGNNDRAYRNLLGDATALIPIDHDQVFHGLGWMPETLARMADQPSHSTLDTDLVYSNDATRELMRAIARDWSARLHNSQSAIMSNFPVELALTDKELGAITYYLTVRAAKLGSLLEQRLMTHRKLV